MCSPPPMRPSETRPISPPPTCGWATHGLSHRWLAFRRWAPTRPGTPRKAPGSGRSSREWTKPARGRRTLEGTDAFASLLAEAPNDFVYPGAPKTPPARELLTAPASPVIFPWQSGTAMIYGPLGVHDGGSGWKAVDMATDGVTSLGHSPGIAVAAKAGTVDYICKDGLSVTLRFGGFLYAHLLNNPGLFAGRTFAQGDELGQLKTGLFQRSLRLRQPTLQLVPLALGFPQCRPSGGRLDLEHGHRPVDERDADGRARQGLDRGAPRRRNPSAGLDLRQRGDRRGNTEPRRWAGSLGHCR